MPRNKDLKRLVRARMRDAAEPYTVARTAILSARAGSPVSTPRVDRPAPHPGVMQLFKEGRWDWVLVTAAAYRCAAQRQGGYDVFPGRSVLEEFGYWLPGLGVLREYGILDKDGESTRGGHRAYYRMPEPEAVAEALRLKGVPFEAKPPSPFEAVPGTEWMSDDLRLYSAMTGETRLSDLDLQLQIAIRKAETEEQRQTFKRLRDEVWQRQFGRPSPTLDRPAGSA